MNNQITYKFVTTVIVSFLLSTSVLSLANGHILASLLFFQMTLLAGIGSLYVYMYIFLED